MNKGLVLHGTPPRRRRDKVDIDYCYTTSDATPGSSSTSLSLSSSSTALSHSSDTGTTLKSRNMRNNSKVHLGAGAGGGTHPLEILPRIGVSDRDEDDVYGVGVGMGGGGGQSRRRRFRWRLLGIGIVVLILVVWVLGPRERRKRVWGVVKSPYPGPAPPSDFDLDKLPSTTGLSNPNPNPNPADTTTLPAPPPPASSLLTYATDPDPSKTIHCTTPYTPTLPLVQWALMIDAGSTGSRIHIYKFHHCRATPEYEYEVFKMTTPGAGGLSKFKGDPEGAAGSLDVLMEEAVRVVPAELRGCTPVAVKATAGLRLLGGEESAAILEAVRRRLEEKYPFPVVKKDGVVIMDGKDEGVYAWITANYLLNTVRSTTPPDTPSYAVLDLGGASTQIVFKPTFSRVGTSLEEGEHTYRLDFGGREHVLYQHSYLGYGLMHARKSVHRLVDFMKWSGDGDDEVANPCLARGTRRVVVVVEDGRGDEGEGAEAAAKRNVTMVGADVGSFEACNRVVELIMAKDAICRVKPCSFNGVYQPSLLDTFPSGKVLLLSYFYDRMAPLLPASNRTFPISTFATFAERVCLGPSSWSQHWGHDATAMEELQGRPEYCLDLTFMHALLRLGYEFEAGREVRMAKKVDETELGWCLGATIALLGGKLECVA